MFISRSDLLTALAFACLAGNASAHGLAQGEADVIVRKDGVTFTREVEPGTEDDARDEVIVRDADGRRISGHIVARVPHGDHVRIDVDHALAASPRWLS